ncbi:glycosyltransferase family 92 protein [Streptococcus equinus]|uniref:glycosyltransferase family 92 protein n=1 Tax=Streptococcus equinus TaxID=1335 RepID=UPI003BF840C8
MIKENRDFIFVEPQSSRVKYLFKRSLGWCASIYYKMLLNAKKVKFKKKKHYASICGIFKNEGLYLKEWIDYHLKIGIDHFYLYNNFSDDNYESVLRPYVQTGIVDLINWPVEQGQLSAYEDCIFKFKSESSWIGFIDIDEFITPLNGVNFINELTKLENRPVVKIYWKIFGSSGIHERDTKRPVTEDFVMSWDKLMNFGKCFFNTSYDFDSKLRQNNAFHHHMWAKNGRIALPPVNVNDIVSLGSYDSFGNKTPNIQINHYIIKSKSEFRNKMARGDVFYKLSSVNEEYFKKYDTRANFEDNSALVVTEEVD